MSVTACYLSGPSPGAVAALASALEVASPGLTVTVESWPYTQPLAGQTILLTPGGIVPDAPWPRTKWFGIVDADFPLAGQVTSALQLLGLGPGMQYPAGEMGNPSKNT